MAVNWPTYRRVLGAGGGGGGGSSKGSSWAGKYLQSDHHVDRVAFEKLAYFNKHGFLYIGELFHGKLE